MCLVTHLSSMPYHFAILNFILCWLNLLDWNQQQHSNGNNYLFTYHTTGRNYLELDLRNYLNWIYSFHSYISLFIYTWPTFFYLLYDITSFSFLDIHSFIDLPIVLRYQLKQGSLVDQLGLSWKSYGASIVTTQLLCALG